MDIYKLELQKNILGTTKTYIKNVSKEIEKDGLIATPDEIVLRIEKAMSGLDERINEAELEDHLNKLDEEGDRLHDQLKDD